MHWRRRVVSSPPHAGSGSSRSTRSGRWQCWSWDSVGPRRRSGAVARSPRRRSSCGVRSTGSTPRSARANGTPRAPGWTASSRGRRAPRPRGHTPSSCTAAHSSQRTRAKPNASSGRLWRPTPRPPVPSSERASELAYDELLRRAGRRVEAREHAATALDRFEGLGAALWAERARVELRASGQTARKRDPSTLADLTPQELQVARFVAEGLTNRDQPPSSS